MPGLDRRRAPRRALVGGESLSRVRLRAGRELVVLDVSSLGVQVEGDVRLLPGTHVDVHIVTAEGRLLVRSRVIRARVVALSAGSVTYRGALAFERAIEIGAPGYDLPDASAPAHDTTGKAYPDRAA